MRTLFLMMIFVSGCSAMLLGGGSGGPATSSGSASSGISDATITAAVKSDLAADAAVNSFMIGVRSRNGKVVLTGTVDSYVAFEQAERITIRTAGVKAIENRITVEAIP